MHMWHSTVQSACFSWKSVSEISFPGNKDLSTPTREGQAWFSMSQEKDPAGPSVFFKLKHVQRPRRAVQWESPKLVLWGIQPKNGAFGLEKKRDVKDHAYLKGCHGKGEADLFAITPERRVRIAGPKLQRSRLQFNRTKQSELCGYRERIVSELPALGCASAHVRGTT